MSLLINRNSNWRSSYLRSVEREYTAREAFVSLPALESRKTGSPHRDRFDLFGTVIRTDGGCDSSNEVEVPCDALSAVLNRFPEGILITGVPGGGKTTVMERVTLQLARIAMTAPDKPAPVFARLRFLARSVEDLVAASFADHGAPATSLDVEDLLDRGDVILLFDGLNEAVEPTEARRMLLVFKKRWSRCGMVFSGREHAEWTELAKWALKLCPLDRDRVVQFASRFAPDLAPEVVAKQKGISSPLLARLACIVLSRADGNTGPTEGDIYRRSAQYYVQRKDMPPEEAERFAAYCFPALVSLGVHQFTSAVSTVPRLAVPWSEALDVIASSIEGTPSAPRWDFAQRLLQHLLNWNLLRQTAGHVEFVHQRFSEYFAAEGLLQRMDRMPAQTITWRYVNQLVWEEPLCLAVSIAEESKQIDRLVDIAGSVDPILADHAMRSARITCTPEQRRARIRSWSSNRWMNVYKQAIEEMLDFDNSDDGSGHSVWMYIERELPRVDVDPEAANELTELLAGSCAGRYQSPRRWPVSLFQRIDDLASYVRMSRTCFHQPPAARSEGNMVFASYASDDYDLVDPYVKALRTAGLDVWFDRDDLAAGDSIPVNVAEGIKKSSAMIVFHSARYAAKRWGNTEWGAFLTRKLSGESESSRRLVVYRLDKETELPDLLVPNLWRSDLSPFQFAGEIADLLSDAPGV